jgi:3-phenylpropionate/trans-cinnamate dioxygenase ferredoxin subunit
MKFFKEIEKRYQIFETVDVAIKMIDENKAIRVEVEQKEICLARNDKEFFAFENKCPHQQLPVVGGFIENNHWICPFHRYSFSLNNGQNKNKSCGALQMFRVEIENNKLFVCVKTKSFLGLF